MKATYKHYKLVNNLMTYVGEVEYTLKPFKTCPCEEEFKAEDDEEDDFIRQIRECDEISYQEDLCEEFEQFVDDACEYEG